MSHALVKTFGFPGTLLHGNPNVVARWLWLRRRLPMTNNGERLLDVGCGSGAFTIGAALRGYEALGLSWDVSNNEKATERAQICGARRASFQICDVRELDKRYEFKNQFDTIICLETFEHVLDDFKLMRDIAECLKPGGRLLVTVPYYHYHAIDSHDNGPFSNTEDGWHVRRGYTSAMFQELCDASGLILEHHSYCSGYVSQKLTGCERVLRKWIGNRAAWLLLFPLRIFPPVLDPIIGRVFDWPYYSIGMEAYKRRTQIWNAESAIEFVQCSKEID